jgi:membrane-bound ClpP family serine protease
MTSSPSGPSLAATQREFASASQISPGMRGTALSVLRPSGKALFADRTVDVVTEGEFISPETPITVIQADGMRVVVRRA